MADYDAQHGREAPPETDLSQAQLDSDEIDLYLGLIGVAKIVAGRREVPDLLNDVAEFAVQAIPAVDGAGVTLIDADSCSPRAEAWAATPQFVRTIDELQYNVLNEGPCVTCMRTRRPTVSGSIGGDDRWPHFGGHVARMGVHSVLALPLMIAGRLIGAITAYAYQRDAFAEHAVQLGAQFAGPAAVSVYNAQLLASAQERTDRLQRAMKSRAVIDQAIGIVRSRSGGSAEEAFERLAKMSQAENVKLHVIAERLVEEAVRRARIRQSSS
ncbi:ANTAR domain-containing protein [Mycolicibacterium sp. P9-64]|uniref:GAF and ANTAR domain-containing protein n=1 Tax=Mycolicibacterium sp. P9-64 TaxID=2024612 RepID=UPI0011EE6827|nr:GAF and ANTAR domain-containing protein [Mycolicibacterium sp. P9-64]KAA0079082.1 ANTAR domain-containing protein [Mycolicibacterium sp. P9-64]